jgi:hypothetical protein
MQFICTIQTSAAGSLTSVKSTSRESPSRGQVRKAARGDPRRLSLRRLLVEGRLAMNAVGVALERERPAAQVRDNRLADGDVVLGEVALGHAVAGKEDALRMRQADAAASDLYLVGHQARGYALHSAEKSRCEREARARLQAWRTRWVPLWLDR